MEYAICGHKGLVVVQADDHSTHFLQYLKIPKFIKELQCFMDTFLSILSVMLLTFHGEV